MKLWQTGGTPAEAENVELTGDMSEAGPEPGVPTPPRPRPFRWSKQSTLFDVDVVVTFDSEQAEILSYEKKLDRTVWLLKSQKLGMMWLQTDFTDRADHIEVKLIGFAEAQYQDRLADRQPRFWEYTVRA